MPKLSKQKQAKKEAKAASSISTAPLLTSTPEPETSAPAEEKAQAPLCEEEDEDDLPRDVSPPETDEQAAARVAAYAAQGRNQWGVLLQPACCPYGASCAGCNVSERRALRERHFTDEECQQIVDLFGWRHGAELILERNEGWTLDDMYGHEMQVAWDEFCAVKERLADVLKAQEERAIEAMRQQNIEDKVAMESRRNLKRKEVVVKKNIPCSRLYSCEGDKNTGGAKPTTMYVSSECWSHERVCPKSGRLLTPHCCPWQHPGEEGWNPHWNRNRLWRPAAAPVPVLPADAHWVDSAHRFAALGGKKVEEAMAAPSPPPTRAWAVPPPPLPARGGGGAEAAASVWGRVSAGGGAQAAAPPAPPRAGRW